MLDNLQLIEAKANKVKQYLLEKEWLQSVDEVKYLAAGEYNENFRVKSRGFYYVFRINHGSQLGLPNQIEYEFYALMALKDSRVTPKAYNYDLNAELFNSGVMLMEYLEGRPLNYETDVQKAAFIFSRVHTRETGNKLIVQGNPLMEMADESKKLLERYKNEDLDEIYNDLMKFQADIRELGVKNNDYFMNEKKCIVNTEVNSGNFILSKNNSYLVDWEKAVIGSRFMDLSHFLVPTTTLWRSTYQYNYDEKKYFLNAYNSFLGNPFKIEDLIEMNFLMEKAIVLKTLSWCYMAFFEFQESDLATKNQDTFNKIRHYLEESEHFLDYARTL